MSSAREYVLTNPYELASPILRLTDTYMTDDIILKCYAKWLLTSDIERRDSGQPVLTESPFIQSDLVLTVF